MSRKPRVLIFTGDGKGKTTAALGMAFRASGHGLRSCIIQFIKSDVSVGEIAAAAASASIEIHPTGRGFLPPADDPQLSGLPGVGILAITWLPLVMPARASTGMILPMLLAGDLFAVAYLGRHAMWRHLWKLLPCAVAGVLMTVVWLTWPRGSRTPREAA